jgi:Glycerol uptake facilitator and related permeases (Major Intrinsic Protein Family)
MGDTQKYLAELIGTFVLVFIGTGAAVIAGKSFGVLGIAFAFGIAVLVMVYAIGPVSGCHINPAVTIAMLVNSRIASKDAIIYIIVQCIGATIASLLLLAIMTGSPAYSLASDGLGQNGYGTASPGGYSLVSCFITEVVLTFIFLFASSGNQQGRTGRVCGIGIGFTLFICHLFGVMVSGSSVNPAGALARAHCRGTALSQLWLYIVAPVIGAMIAALVWKYLFGEAAQAA